MAEATLDEGDIGESEVAELVEGRHRDPCAWLGLHADATGQYWLRALLPGVSAVSVVAAHNGKTLKNLVRYRESDLFVGKIPLFRRRFDYRLRLVWPNGESELVADAYAFDSDLDAGELAAWSSGEAMRAYLTLGAHLRERQGVKGVRFAVWAPNASRVSVVGDFNGWDGRRHAMRHHYPSGVWDLFVPGAEEGDCYRYEIRSQSGEVLPLKSDPFAFASELRPASASIVAPLPTVSPLPVERHSLNRPDAAISIYELHLGSWRRRHGDETDPATGGEGFYRWDDLVAELPDYVAELGFTHVEVLPLTEHPFDGSWGYQSLGMFAPSARFGEPTGLKRLIAALHQRGIGLILDWTPAHFPSDAYGLARFDGTALFEYDDPREGFHPDWQTLIFNYKRNEVRSFLLSAVGYWLERFGVDGLRVDAVSSMLYRDYSRKPGEWIANDHGGRDNLEAIDLLRTINRRVAAEHPGAMMIAEESTAYPGVTTAIDQGGLGFTFKWNMGWMHDTLRYFRHDPIHRRWHHRDLSFGLCYAFSEHFILPLSHDEVVHGKGSLLGKMPGDPWQAMAHLRLLYGLMWGHPGKKLLFMGGELAAQNEWNHDSALDWASADETGRRGMRQWLGDLNRAYRNYPQWHLQDGVAAGFGWLQEHAEAESVWAWRRDDGQRPPLVVVINATPVVRHQYPLPVPAGVAVWREVLNSDAEVYGGSGVGNLSRALAALPGADGLAQLHLTLPPLAMLLLEAVT